MAVFTYSDLELEREGEFATVPRPCKGHRHKSHLLSEEVAKPPAVVTTSKGIILLLSEKVNEKAPLDKEGGGGYNEYKESRRFVTRASGWLK